MVSLRAASLLGKPAGEVAGKADADLLPPEAADPLVEVDLLVMDSGEAVTVEESFPVGVPRPRRRGGGMRGDVHRGLQPSEPDGREEGSLVGRALSGAREGSDPEKSLI